MFSNFIRKVNTLNFFRNKNVYRILRYGRYNLPFLKSFTYSMSIGKVKKNTKSNIVFSSEFIISLVLIFMNLKLNYLFLNYFLKEEKVKVLFINEFSSLIDYLLVTYVQAKLNFRKIYTL